MTTALKPFQERIVIAATKIIKRDISEADASRATILLEAPTGSGKTLMAGTIAERAAGDDRIVWLWFAPFDGLIRQTSRSLREEFPGLRVRNVRTDRAAVGTRSGDTFVMTWATVATERRESRRVRQDDEAALSLDALVVALRAATFRLGVVVDEAHHGFVRARSAVRFYTQVLVPDVTILVTATPDDQDLARFQQAAGITEPYVLRASRAEAIQAGLIKQGVRSVAYLPDSPEARRLVDLRLQALKDGLAMHERIKAGLVRMEVPLTPLLLVQVSSSEGSVDEVRKWLRELGLRDEAIAVYTAREPDDDLEQLAANETKQALIFKMAVALGFDAPRAFTLVTMRSSRDPDFGTQIVGRILRVHRLLQGRAQPELLRYGYVYLSEERVQQGLADAAKRINSIVTEFGVVAPEPVVIAQIGEERRFFSADRDAAVVVPAPSWLVEEPGEGPRLGKAPAAVLVHRYPLHADLPRRFKTERITLDRQRILDSVVESVDFSDPVLTSGYRESAFVRRIEQEVFTRTGSTARISAEFSPEQLAQRGQRALALSELLSLKELYPMLLDRLIRRYAERGMRAPEDITLALNTILAVHPRLIRDALMNRRNGFIDLYDTEPIPDEIASEVPLPPSNRGAYGVMNGLNTWERRFVELLDHDDSGIAAWWIRNEDRPQDPRAVAVALADGSQFFPDFLVGVRGRDPDDDVGILLVEVKEDLQRPDSLEKATARHQQYGKVLMVHLDVQRNEWNVVDYDYDRERNVIGAVYRPSLMPAF